MCAAMWVLPFQGLSMQGGQCLGLSLMIVIWWARQVAQPGYVSGAYLALLCLFRVADPAVIFSSWTSSLIWLIPGAYLIAAAVQKSGLGERLSYILILRFVRGWTSIIGMIFALTLVLSLLIPHPWPRAFLILSVMTVVIRAANLPKKDAVAVGFTVFAAQVPVSLIFLTGDAGVNSLAASYAPELMDFWGWFRVMGVPACLSAVRIDNADHFGAVPSLGSGTDRYGAGAPSSAAVGPNLTPGGPDLGMGYAGGGAVDDQ